MCRQNVRAKRKTAGRAGSGRPVGHIAIGLGNGEIDMSTFMGARIEQEQDTPGVKTAWAPCFTGVMPGLAGDNFPPPSD
jgi:hypothetical protein